MADARVRAIAHLRATASIDDDALAAAIRSAFIAGVATFEIAEITGLDEPRVLDTLGQSEAP